jgi:hypothetical protein
VQPKEFFALVMDRQEVPRVPFIETSIAFKLIKDLGPGYGWCLSASNSVPDYVKPENLLSMAETVRKYGAYPIDVH